MNRLLIIFFVFLVVIFSGCDKTNYDKGYANGFQAGQSKGDLEGFERGRKDGYQLGYTDGFAKSGKDLKVTDVTINFLTTNSLVIFGKVVAWIFIILNSIVVFFCFMTSSKIRIILAKIFTFIIAIGLAYSLMLIIDVNKVLFFKLDGWLAYIIIGLLFLFSLLLSHFIYKFLDWGTTYLILGVLFIATFIGFYYSLFLTDIYTYIITNGFIMGAIASTIFGVLIYTVFELVRQQKEEDGLST